MVAVNYLSHTDNKKEIRKILLSFVKSIQERDLATYEHSRRVAVYAQRLARHLGWTRREALDLARAALVHDLGKTWIANDILNKSAALSAEERRKIQNHPVIGAGILIGCDVSPFYIETVLYHHEAWNGQGYPVGLKGEEIPLSARMLAIADVYDVLTSQRTYKAPLTIAEARKRLHAGSGINFDPTILQAFLDLLDTKPNFTLTHYECAVPLAEVSKPELYAISMAGLEVYPSKSQDIGRYKSIRV
jgi:putative two-component system response regulator